MEILGLSADAQVVILQALATYTGIASAFLFARPVLGGQNLQAQRELLSSLRPKDDDVADLVSQASNVLNERSQRDLPKVKSDNRWGFVLLIVSFLLFTAAVAVQIEQVSEPPRSADSRLP